MLDSANSQRLRQSLKAAVRDFFSKRSYQEVETPIAVVCPGTEVHLQYFKTNWRNICGDETPLWLRSSPELHMKQLLADGLPRIFQISTCFRNQGEFADWHHPEFTMLEWYEAGISYDDFIKQTEQLIQHCAQFMAESIRSAGLIPAALPASFQRMTVSEAFKEFAGISLVDRDPDLAKIAAKSVLSVNSEDDFETAFFKILLDKVEPELLRRDGVILCDYPPSQAALALEENGVARRFEFYWRGIELCNGFNELLGERENRERISGALAERAKLGHELPTEDQDFYDAMSRGVPPCCGNALGFDRLLALLCNQNSIAPFIPFRNARVWRDHEHS